MSRGALARIWFALIFCLALPGAAPGVTTTEIAVLSNRADLVSEPNFTGWHDPTAQARAQREDPVVPHLVGSRRRDQRNQALDQLASLHQDLRGAVAPAGLQAKQEPENAALANWI